MVQPLSELFVRIGVDLSGLNEGFRKVAAAGARLARQLGNAARRIARSFAGVARTVGRLARRFALAGTLMVGAFVATTAASLHSTDQLGKFSTRLGIATEAVGTFRFIARQSGIEFQQFSIAIQRMTRRVADAVGESNEFSKAFKELGLDVNRLIGLRPEEQFLAIAAALDQVENSSQRAALAQKIFDSEGVAVLQTLDDGIDGLREMAREAELLGAAMSATAVRGVEEANNALGRLFTLFRGIRDSIVAALAPAIELLADLITDNFLDSLTQSGQTIESWARQVAVSILELVRDVTEAIGRFVQFSLRNLRALGDLLEVELVSPDFITRMDAAFANANDVILRMIEVVRELGVVSIDVGEGIGGTFEEAFSKIDEAGSATAQGLEDGLARLFRTGKFGVKDFVDTFLREWSRLAANATLRQFFGEEEAGGGNRSAGFFSGIFDFFFGGSAGGSRVFPGVPRIVGERGPEVIVPDRTATVMNNADSRRAFGMGGGGVVINFSPVNRFDVGLETFDRRLNQATEVMGEQFIDFLTNQGIATA